jgi:predicted nucleic acid-binding protein
VIASLHGRHKRVLIDTSIWIYHFQQHPVFCAAAGALIENLEDGKFRGIASELTLLELTVRLLQHGRQDAADDYEILLDYFPNLELVPISREILMDAAGLRALSLENARCNSPRNGLASRRNSCLNDRRGMAYGSANRDRYTFRPGEIDRQMTELLARSFVDRAAFARSVLISGFPPTYHVVDLLAHIDRRSMQIHPRYTPIRTQHPPIRRQRGQPVRRRPPQTLDHAAWLHDTAYRNVHPRAIGKACSGVTRTATNWLRFFLFAACANSPLRRSPAIAS